MKIIKYLNPQPLKNYAIYFIIYSVIGFTIEFIYNSMQEADMIKEFKYHVYCGFIYGIIAIILIFLYQKQIREWSVGFDIIVTSISICVCQIILIKILTLTNLNYRLLWSYENTTWVIKDTISIPYMIILGILATFCLWFIQPILEQKLNPANNALN